MTQSISLVSATPDYIAAISDLDARIFTEQPFPPQYYYEALNISALEIIAATNDQGALLGYATVFRSRKEDAVVVIGTIAVAPEVQRNGIGMSIVSKVKQNLSMYDAEMVRIHTAPTNKAAKSLFSRLGFEEMGVLKNFFGPSEDRSVFEWRPSL